jgi:hypothetical protein
MLKRILFKAGTVPTLMHGKENLVTLRCSSELKKKLQLMKNHQPVGVS